MTCLSEKTHPGEFILAEQPGHLSREVVTIVSGSGVITAGMVLGAITASGKYKPFDADATDGSQLACAIAYDRVDATTSDAEAVVLYRDAEVRLSSLQWAPGNDAGDIVAGIQWLAAQNLVIR